MPSLGVEKLQKILLPSTKDEANEVDRAWVIMDITMMAGTFIGVEKYETRIEQQAFVLSHAIKEWNLTESPTSDKIAEITPDNTRKIGFSDFWFLSDCIGKITDEQVGGIGAGLKET